MKYILYFSILIALVFLVSCSSGRKGKMKPQAVKDNLFRTWHYSFEESGGDTLTFRTIEHNLPRIKGRYKYEFHPDGTFILHGFAPNDLPVKEYGQWDFSENMELKIEYGKAESRTLRYLVLNAETDRLVLTLHPED